MALTFLWTCEVKTVFTIFLSYLYLQLWTEKFNQIDQLDFHSKNDLWLTRSRNSTCTYYKTVSVLRSVCEITQISWTASEWPHDIHFLLFEAELYQRIFCGCCYFGWVVVVISVIFASLLPCPHANIRKRMSASVCHSITYAHCQAAVDSQCCCFCCFEIMSLREGEVRQTVV